MSVQLEPLSSEAFPASMQVEEIEFDMDDKTEERAQLQPEIPSDSKVQKQPEQLINWDEESGEFYFNIKLPNWFTSIDKKISPSLILSFIKFLRDL